MKIQPTNLSDVYRLTPDIFEDARGSFLELFHSRKFREAGLPVEFVQDNVSHSRRGVLRGLHYQIEQPQGKFVTVLAGEILDVAVDLRRQSSQFGKWAAFRIDGEQHEGIYLPPGFAHGFYVLSESATVLYKCTDWYHAPGERTLLWNDPALAIDWQLQGPPILSDKDQQGIPLADAECFA